MPESHKHAGFRPRFREAVVLAGGLGTRLREAVPGIPKCLAPVRDRPFLHFVLRYFQSQGLNRFIFALGYRHEEIQQFLADYASGEKNFRYTLSIEEEPLGTGGAVRKALPFIKDPMVLLLNGDTFFMVDTDALALAHAAREAECTIALKPLQHFDRYGVVALDKEGSVRQFLEKKTYAEGLINGGVYALNPDGFRNRQFPDKFSFEKNYLERFYPERKIFGIVQDAYFIDIGIPADYQRAQREFEDFEKI
jgi:D-glycero-alpha-D-manno-heptose 1-phosphate guanylyltransferase